VDDPSTPGATGNGLIARFVHSRAMIGAVIILMGVALAISLLGCAGLIALGHRLGTLDSAGVPGQEKAPPRRVPNTGGVAIFWAVAGPMALALAAAYTGWLDRLPLPSALSSALAEHADGLRSEALHGLVLVLGLLVLHIVGLVDDRRALGPLLKLAIMLGVAGGVVLGTQSRMLTLLDPIAGGAWLSVLLTVLWIVAVTNAVNFLDNMDGLSAGVAWIASACFLAAALIQGQWFIAGTLALLIGALAGFLAFNFPWQARGTGPDGRPTGGARLFMGDGGSLVVGFLLAFLTVRTTYLGPELGGGWYGVLMPVLVLAVPLYDLLIVSVIRLRAGRSPMVGDLNHLSHRLVRRGLSQRSAVLAIYGLTAITALPSIGLAGLKPWHAALVGGQVLITLVLIAILEAKADFASTIQWSSPRDGPGTRPNA
jgi:UDP-GlcNAc:undecaprenyl-phosphate GlcNAc-1-phosphate transferase